MSKARRAVCCLVVCLLSALFYPFCAISSKAYEKERIEIPVICLDVEELDEHIYDISIETEDPFAPVPLSFVPKTVHVPVSVAGQNCSDSALWPLATI